MHMAACGDCGVLMAVMIVSFEGGAQLTALTFHTAIIALKDQMRSAGSSAHSAEYRWCVRTVTYQRAIAAQLLRDGKGSVVVCQSTMQDASCVKT